MEKKYPITEEQFGRLMARIGAHITPDEYGETAIASLYLDTPSSHLIRYSIDTDNYKEKFRIRAYGTPSPDSTVFFEVKRKADGIVSKRRLAMPLALAEAIARGEAPMPPDTQIGREMAYSLARYTGIAPSVVILCERSAFCGREDPSLRLTFDRNIRYRTEPLTLCAPPDGTPLMPPDGVLIEIKAVGAMPLWLSHALAAEHIYPARFSKYATAFRRILNKGESSHV